MARPRPAPKATARSASPPRVAVRRQPAPAQTKVVRGQVLVRPGATRVEVFNSGLEVWLYDDARLDDVRSKGLWRVLLDGGKTDGALVGYCVEKDGPLKVDVVVGPALTSKELAVTQWLEPQHAWLRLPSGALVVETNDTARVDDEPSLEVGALLAVPKGNYRVTLHRVDQEALAQQGVAWAGAREVVVLTPSRTPNDAAGLLPFEKRVDVSFVGRLDVQGNHGRGLVWFENHWETFFANIDGAAAHKLGLAPGKWLRTTVPDVNLTVVAAIVPSLDGAPRSKYHSAGRNLAEFGFGAISASRRWAGHETLAVRRLKATTPVERKHLGMWMEALFEVMDSKTGG
jgi:hypothetical protein